MGVGVGSAGDRPTGRGHTCCGDHRAARTQIRVLCCTPGSDLTSRTDLPGVNTKGGAAEGGEKGRRHVAGAESVGDHKAGGEGTGHGFCVTWARGSRCSLVRKAQPLPRRVLGDDD